MFLINQNTATVRASARIVNQDNVAAVAPHPVHPFQSCVQRGEDDASYPRLIKDVEIAFLFLEVHIAVSQKQGMPVLSSRFFSTAGDVDEEGVAHIGQD
jgi:hypothetical protein